MNFQMFKLDFKKEEEPEIKLPTSIGSSKKQEFQKNICFIDYAKAFDCVHHNKLWKILQARLQQYVNCELPDVQAGFRKGTRGQIANICWIIKKAREFQKSIYFCFSD